MFALAPPLTLRQPIEDSDDHREQRDAPQNDKRIHLRPRHRRLLPLSSKHPPNTTAQIAKPIAAVGSETGAPLTNGPNTSAPNARFAASGSLSRTICRCSGVKSSEAAPQTAEHAAPPR